jgi:hypothetical protein
MTELYTVDIVGAWLGIFLTFCILSFLYKDNPFYKFAEHLFVGVSIGYLVSLQYYNVLRPKVIEPLLDGSTTARLVAMIPLVLVACMFVKAVSRRFAWVGRYPLGFAVALFAGIQINAVAQAELGAQMKRAMSDVDAEKLDVNQADAKQLALLPGMTPIIARKIVEYRQPVVGVGAGPGDQSAVAAMTEAAEGSKLALIVVYDERWKPASKAETVKDKTPIAAGKVYLAPPDKDPVIEEGMIRLVEPDPAAGRVDRFLTSLAAAYGPSSTAIVLPGAEGAAAGLAAIGEAGGTTDLDVPQLIERSRITSLDELATIPSLIDEERELLAEARGSIKGLDAQAHTGEGGRYWFGIFSNLLLLAGTLSTLLYFYFSLAHKGVVGKVSRFGVWILMIGFGASFGYTVQGRIALAIGRAQDVMGTRLAKADADAIQGPWAALVSVAIIVAGIAIWEMRARKQAAGKPS